jgi:methionyl-tRNA synthetase
MANKFYITTPIYYVNDRAHLGHAYTTIAADSLSRYHHLLGDKTFFLTGTDEHGIKIQTAAEKAGKKPQKFCDENAKYFKDAWKDLNIDFDNFIRTSDLSHIKAIQKALDFLYKKGFIYKGTYEGLYCPGCEQYKTENDLVDGKCPDHQRKPEKMKEESYLFKLSAFEKDLIKLIEKDEFKIEPKERKNEVLGFLKQGLQDISISRQKVEWGVPLPFDKDLTAYVWVDALLNYLTGIGWKGDDKKVPDFWPADIHLMSKDILRIHATIWPALLLALEIPLPKKLFIHGYFTINGQKMSKSIGNVIWPEEMVEKFGVDATRYLLLSACPFGRDGDISWEKLTEKYNADLANGIGNLTNRILTMVEKKLDGKIEEISKNKPKSLEKLSKEYDKLFNELRFEDIIKGLMTICLELDKKIDQEEVYRMEKEEFSKNVYYFIETLRIWAWFAKPFIPETSEKIFNQLGLKSENKKKFKEAIKWGGIKKGTKIKKGKPLFPRIS